ncbi:putative non-specific serine/threonine protein kinase [Rosa chinensis]|uniref:Putative non-specific serine/threonine protein kinase n=1 Tax=Rosa chinensis TaxID=74649 RepID=A0A2P6PXS6_ROSCH|nr:putative non-specific serine/threonine protein kinase [Rosa chinensis]
MFSFCLKPAWLVFDILGKLVPGFKELGRRIGLIMMGCYSAEFGFGFYPTPQDVTLFLLVVIHMNTYAVVWAANRGSPVSNTDKFVFDDKGSVSLQKSGSVVWSIDTGGKTVTAMELRDSGNLVLLGDDNGVDFQEGMKLVSDPSSNNVSYILEIKFGDMILSSGFQTPQPYWSV